MRISLQLDIELHVQYAHDNRRLSNDVFYIDCDYHVKSFVISCQMQQFVFNRRETNVVSTCSQFANDVSFLQRFAIARDVYVVRQNVDIIYEIYDCDFVFESFKNFQNVCVIKKL
jgi:hypothetical protein